MKRFLGLAVAGLLVGGCAVSQHYWVKENAAVLPGGDTIQVVEEVKQEFAHEMQTNTYAVWNKDGAEKKLVMMRQEGWVLPAGAQRQTHATADGKRAWQTVDGKTVMSFDYDEAVAIMGDHGQPEWAAAK